MELYNITVGCKTIMPELPHRYFTVHLQASTYPTKTMVPELINFLDPYTAEIIDEIGFIMDADSGKVIWAIHALEDDLLMEQFNDKETTNK